MSQSQEDRKTAAGWVAFPQEWALRIELRNTAPLLRCQQGRGRWALFWLMAMHMRAVEETGDQDVRARFREGSVLWTPQSDIPKCE